MAGNDDLSFFASRKALNGYPPGGVTASAKLSGIYSD